MRPWLPLAGACLVMVLGCQSGPAAEGADEAQQATAEPAPTERAAPAEEQETGLVLVEEGFPGIQFQGRQEVDGLIQIYWFSQYRPSSSDPDEWVQERELMMQFVLAPGEAEGLPEIPCDSYDRTPSVLELATEHSQDGAYPTRSGLSAKAEKLVEVVEIIPEQFHRYQEGMIQQPGTLSFDGLYSYIECDAPYAMVVFEDFQPRSLGEEERAQWEEQGVSAGGGGCGESQPWEETFVLSDGQRVFDAPHEGAVPLEWVEQSFVIKIQTVDDEWMEVRAPFEESLRGFVRSAELEIAN